MIRTQRDLEQAALRYGILPFFSNHIPGFSVEEMAAPGVLFGGTTGDYGCWEWKGPVIQEQTTAYGKFFNRRAGFVSFELLPDFLNYRRQAYPVSDGSTERMILDTIAENQGLTSTELKRLVFGPSSRNRDAAEPVDVMAPVKARRHSLEGPLQRLQMAGRLLIADFEYKLTSDGRRYGWGVALYSTPEIWFHRLFNDCERTPEESFRYLVEELARRLDGVPEKDIARLLK